MSTPDRSIENDKTLIGRNYSPQEQSLGNEATFTNESKRGETPDSSFGVDLTSRYEIISVIGQGGMGKVYLAQDRRLKRKVAIKRIKSINDSTAKRFLVEAESLASINHYNIVQIFDYGHDAEGPYLIMEYVEAGTLADLLKAGPIQVDQSIRITCQLAEVLGKAHERGIIHRDIKPANILMTKDGQPKLIDFGLARDDSADSNHTIAGAVLGTLDYMPPEQRLDATLTDARSDLWSLAATFYQMVTGKSPRVVRLNLLPANLQDFAAKALEDDPAERYQTARDFVICLGGQIRSNPFQAVQSDDFQAGVCINCNAVNELNRKFCRKCANPLQTLCLNCESEMPVWDNICGECGGNQSKIIRQQEQEYADLIIECNILISNNKFAEAAKIIDLVKKLDKYRFTQFIDQVMKLKTVLEQSIEKSQQRKANDLESRIRICVREINENKCLDNKALIISAIDLTNKYLELNPNHEKIKNLRQSLLSRKGDPAGTRKLIKFEDCELAFCWCPPSKFLMGSPQSEQNRRNDENQVSVTLSKGFWIMETVVTQKLWQTLTGEQLDWEIRCGLGEDYPAYYVSWEMALDFCKKITSKLQSSGLIPRELCITLPTEAQWEYACRAGTQTAYSFGNDPSKLMDYAWFDYNSQDQLHPVRQKKPNDWGLYDMHGNVFEWTADEGYSKVLPGGIDPCLSLSEGIAALTHRGGSYRSEADRCRSAFRNEPAPNYSAYHSFRLAQISSR